jgi:hypothetical protein
MKKEKDPVKLSRREKDRGKLKEEKEVKTEGSQAGLIDLIKEISWNLPQQAGPEN